MVQMKSSTANCAQFTRWPEDNWMYLNLLSSFNLFCCLVSIRYSILIFCRLHNAALSSWNFIMWFKWQKRNDKRMVMHKCYRLHTNTQTHNAAFIRTKRCAIKLYRHNKISSMFPSKLEEAKPPARYLWHPYMQPAHSIHCTHIHIIISLSSYFSMHITSDLDNTNDDETKLRHTA